MTEEGALSLDEGGAWRYWNLWVVLVSISSYDAKHVRHGGGGDQWRSVEMDATMAWYSTTSTAVGIQTDHLPKSLTTSSFHPS